MPIKTKTTTQKPERKAVKTKNCTAPVEKMKSNQASSLALGVERLMQDRDRLKALLDEAERRRNEN